MRKQFIAFIILFLSCSHCFSQDSLRKKKGFYGGVFVSPDASATYLKDFNSGGGVGIGYTAGLDFKYKFNSTFNFSFGIQIANKQLGSLFSASAGNQNAILNLVVKNFFVEIPLRIEIRLQKDKYAPLLTTGISTNFLAFRDYGYRAGGNPPTYFRDTEVGFFKGKLNVNPQFHFGMGLDASFKEFILQIVPLLRVSILPMDFDGAPIQYFYSFGLGISFTF